MSMRFTAADLAVAIPTIGRGQVLLDTIQGCLGQSDPPAEIVVMDQTAVHEQHIEKALRAMHEMRAIRWERMSRPSIPSAMNLALLSTAKPIILFLDDDVVPARDLIRAHVRAHNENDAWAVIGQIIQPWQTATDVGARRSESNFTADFEFPFHCTQACWLQNAMAGHMSVRREMAVQIGGFDENFKGAAFRFETEFARRVIRAGGRIRFYPAASIRHLRAARGGTRSYGDHLGSPSPIHGVGDYYFAMLQGWTAETVAYMARRMIREVATRFHVRHPWLIPVKLVGEMRALRWAMQLKRQGQALLREPLESFLND